MTGTSAPSIDWANHPAAKPGEFRLGGDLIINRLSCGSMRLTGKGVWGQPKDRKQAVRVLQRAIELGINFIDTADSYGPRAAGESADTMYTMRQAPGMNSIHKSSRQTR